MYLAFLCAFSKYVCNTVSVSALNSTKDRKFPLLQSRLAVESSLWPQKDIPCLPQYKMHCTILLRANFFDAGSSCNIESRTLSILILGLSHCSKNAFPVNTASIQHQCDIDSINVILTFLMSPTVTLLLL